MKVLGVNFSHNCSFAYFENNILKEYYEEDRFNKDKGFRPPHPFLGEYNIKLVLIVVSQSNRVLY